MLNRKTVKVTFENGDTIVTDINGSEEEVRDYYMNNYFNLTPPSSKEEPMTKGKTVEFIYDEEEIQNG